MNNSTFDIADAVLTWRAAKDELKRNPQYHFAVAKMLAARQHGLAVRGSLSAHTNDAVPVYGSPERPKREMARPDMTVISTPQPSMMKAA